MKNSLSERERIADQREQQGNNPVPVQFEENALNRLLRLAELRALHLDCEALQQEANRYSLFPNPRLEFRLALHLEPAADAADSGREQPEQVVHPADPGLRGRVQVHLPVRETN